MASIDALRSGLLLGLWAAFGCDSAPPAASPPPVEASRVPERRAPPELAEPIEGPLEGCSYMFGARFRSRTTVLSFGEGSVSISREDTIRHSTFSCTLSGELRWGDASYDRSAGKLISRGEVYERVGTEGAAKNVSSGPSLERLVLLAVDVEQADPAGLVPFILKQKPDVVIMRGLGTQAYHGRIEADGGLHAWFKGSGSPKLSAGHLVMSRFVGDFRQGRDLLEARIGDRDLVIASKDRWPAEAFKEHELLEASDVILFLSLDFGDGDPRNTPLEQPGYRDVWKALHPNDEGITVDAAGMRGRMHRLLIRSAKWKADSIELVPVPGVVGRWALSAHLVFDASGAVPEPQRQGCAAVAGKTFVSKELQESGFGFDHGQPKKGWYFIRFEEKPDAYREARGTSSHSGGLNCVGLDIFPKEGSAEGRWNPETGGLSWNRNDYVELRE